MATLKTMKKSITFLFSLIVSFYFSQDNNESSNSVTELIVKTLLIIFFLFILYKLIAWIEGRGKEKDLTIESSTDLFYILISSVIINLFLFGYLFSKDSSFPIQMIIITAFIIKLILAIIVSKSAMRLNRNSTLWFILGFIEYHSALLVLMSSSALLKTINTEDENNKNINETYKNKLNALLELKNTGMLNNDEFQIKRKQIQDEYDNYIQKFNINLNIVNEEKIVLEKIKKLKIALEQGIITQEEFDSKSSEINISNNENHIP